MSTNVFKGDAFFVYDLPISPFGQVTHTLAIPLYQVRPIDRRARHDWWAEDLDTREVITIGDGVKEVWATIRLDDEPTALKQMLRLALQYDLTLYYSEESIVYPVRLVEVAGASSMDETPIEPDRDRHGFGEWEVRLHLRRTDGGVLDGIFDPLAQSST